MRKSASMAVAAAAALAWAVGTAASAQAPVAEAAAASAVDARELLDRGRAAFKAGDFERAATLLDQALKQDPGLKPATTLLAQARGRLLARGADLRDDALEAVYEGDYARAISLYDQAERLRPADYEIPRDRGTARRWSGDWAGALTDYGKALAVKPGAADVLINRGALLGQRGEFDLAMADFAQGLALHPRDERLMFNRGTIRMRAGEFDLAIADFDQAAALKPKWPDPILNRAAARFLKGDLDGALADYDLALLADPRQQDTVRHGRANVLRRKGEFDKATAELDPLLAGPTPNLAVLNLRVLIRSDAGDVAGAAADEARLAAAIEAELKRGKRSGVLAWRAEQLTRRGAFEPALADWARMQADWPLDPNVRGGRARTWMAKGDWALAVADYDEALRMEPMRADYYAGRCLAKAWAGADLPAAEADCARALRLRPPQADALEGRGLLRLRQGRFAEAEADLSQALALEPRRAGALHLRGVARGELGRGAEGKADLTAAAAVDPGVARRYEQAGVRT